MIREECEWQHEETTEGDNTTIHPSKEDTFLEFFKCQRKYLICIRRHLDHGSGSLSRRMVVAEGGGIPHLALMPKDNVVKNYLQ